MKIPRIAMDRDRQFSTLEFDQGGVGFIEERIHLRLPTLFAGNSKTMQRIRCKTFTTSGLMAARSSAEKRPSSSMVLNSSENGLDIQ